MKINIDSQTWYEYKDIRGNNSRTKSRLEEISKMGLEVCGEAQFGYKDVMSGLYIEMIWSYSKEEWNDYIKWVKYLIKKNQEKPLPPKFVLMGNTVLMLKGNTYYRDGGELGIGFRYEDDVWISWCPEHENIHKKVLIKTTFEKYKESILKK